MSAVCLWVGQLTVKSTAAWTLSHMAKGGGVSGRPFVEAGLLPILATVLQDHSVRGREQTGGEEWWACGGRGGSDLRQMSGVLRCVG